MSVNIALLTVTDTRTLKTDKSGNILVDKISKANHNLVDRKICKDSKKEIKKIIKKWLKKKKIDVIITTGGTGVSPRDRTPEATRLVLDYEIPGIPEAIRISTRQFTEMSMLTRGLAGSRSKCLIINLPGSPKGVEQGLEVISQVIRHTIALCQDTDQMHLG